MRVWAVAVAALATSAACEKRNISLLGRPCEDGPKPCATGFACHPDDRICVPEVRVGCGVPGAVCPSEVKTGDLCDAPGAFLPCCDGLADCRRGCRTCQDNNLWSACPPCALGIVTSCADCCDDCTGLAHVAQASCSATPACQIDQCQDGFADTDGLTTTGCEVQCAPVPDVCDGLDNDCDGLTDRDDTDIDGQDELDTACGALHCPAGCNVDAWACSGACAIGACAPDQWNADGSLSNGCEYTCIPTAPATERCDGTDNDCDNRIDTADPDLDTQTELDASCAVDRCPSCGVANWMCDGNACTIMACDSLHKDLDAGPGNGCECAIESNAAFCLRLGKNCNIVTANDNCATARTVNCGACTLPELCGTGGGSANVCRSWWDCRWAWRRRITVSTTADLAAGYSLYAEFDHANLVTGGVSLGSGHDVRVLRRSGTTWTELPRVADPEPRYGWNQNATRVWFATATSLAAGASDNEYFLYYGYTGAPAPTWNEAQVFHFADFFDRGPLEGVDNGWQILDLSTGTAGDIDIANNALFFETTSDLNNRPVAEHTFTPITTALVWRIGFDWGQPLPPGTPGSETTYRVHMQMGDSAAMIDPPVMDVYESRGTSANLAWMSPNQCSGCVDEQLTQVEAAGPVRMATISGSHDISVTAHVATNAFDLFVDGNSRATSHPFYAPSAKLDKVRFFTWNVGNTVLGRRFTYTLVRRYVNPEPSTGLAPPDPGNCD